MSSDKTFEKTTPQRKELLRRIRFLEEENERRCIEISLLNNKVSELTWIITTHISDLNDQENSQTEDIPETCNQIVDESINVIELSTENIVDEEVEKKEEEQEEQETEPEEFDEEYFEEEEEEEEEKEWLEKKKQRRDFRRKKLYTISKFLPLKTILEESDNLDEDLALSSLISPVSLVLDDETNNTEFIEVEMDEGSLLDDPSIDNNITKRELKTEQYAQLLLSSENVLDDPEKDFETLENDYARYVSSRLVGSEMDNLSQQVQNVNKRVERAWKYLRIINYLRVCRSNSDYFQDEKNILNLLLNTPDGLRILEEEKGFYPGFEDCLFPNPPTSFQKFSSALKFLEDRLTEIKTSKGKDDYVENMLQRVKQESIALLTFFRHCQALLKIEEVLPADERDLEAEDFFENDD